MKCDNCGGDVPSVPGYVFLCSLECKYEDGFKRPIPDHIRRRYECDKNPQAFKVNKNHNFVRAVQSTTSSISPQTQILQREMPPEILSQREDKKSIIRKNSTIINQAIELKWKSEELTAAIEDFIESVKDHMEEFHKLKGD